MIVKQLADMLNETIKPEIIGTNAEIKFENYDWVDVGISTTIPVEPVPPEPPAPVVTPYARWEFDEFDSVPQTIVNTATPATPYTANWTNGYTGYSELEDRPLLWNGYGSEFYELNKGGYCSIPFTYSNGFKISVDGTAFASGAYPKKESVACQLLNITGLNLVVNCLTRDPDSIEDDDKEIKLFTKLGNNLATYTASDVVEDHNEYKMPAWNYNSDFNVTIEKDAESIALKVNGELKVKWATPEYTGETNAVLGNSSYYMASMLMSFNAEYRSFNIDYIE